MTGTRFNGYDGTHAYFANVRWEGAVRGLITEGRNALYIDTVGICFGPQRQSHFFIMWSDVTGFEIAEGSERVTLTRAVGLGLLAVGAKKKTSYIHLDTKTGSGTFQLRVAASDARAYCRPVIPQPKNDHNPTPSPSTPSPSTSSPDPIVVIEALKTLDELRASGALTPEEFTAQKQKLLNP